MGQLKFLVELTRRTEYPPELALSANAGNYTGSGSICVIGMSPHPASSYWLDWGGTYDNPEHPRLELYFDGFLTQTPSFEVLLNKENSYYVDGGQVYIHLPKKPWQYKNIVTELSIREGYSSAVADVYSPSDVSYDGEGYSLDYPVRLSVPGTTLDNDLSGTVHGTALNAGWSVTLDNRDGKFDKTADANFFHTPISLLKSTEDTRDLADFITVRRGVVDDIETEMETITFKALDAFGTLDDQVCREFTAKAYPDAPDAWGKSIPKAWGQITGAPLFKVGENQYVVCDHDYLTGVTAIYDAEGKITRTPTWRKDTGIIDYSGDAERCDFLGKAENTIGAIITTETERCSEIAYAEGLWDRAETDQYVKSSAGLNLYVSGGSVRELIEDCLKNDSIFLIQKNDGRLTLRRWGENYMTHSMDSWQITQPPVKTPRKSKFFASSVAVEYGYDQQTNKNNEIAILGDDDDELVEPWRKRQRLTFETYLASRDAAMDLARRLLDRFSARVEVWEISTGYNTAAINLLDQVNLKINVNGREMSDVNRWIVTTVNPAQDTLILEERR